MATELRNLLSPDSQTSLVGVKGELISIIDISMSSKMEHTYTSRRVGASTGVISTSVRSAVIFYRIY